ncbi:hypothetical protein [Micromonospora profundi]|uniref:Uncharacterized protein n=1 Tax=Micromonospora profundi TaxID=1420889 RepID=A0AAJ6L5L4_9ACTN|nr:hypothetical protein [Micromonospora profundi]WLS46033.1 hypothetical protein Q3V37_01725 [Micromonospora profundi]
MRFAGQSSAEGVANPAAGVPPNPGFFVPQAQEPWTRHPEGNDDKRDIDEFLRSLNVDTAAFGELQSEYRQAALLNMGVMAGVYFKLEVTDSATSVRIQDVRLALNASSYERHASFDAFWALLEPHGGVAVISAEPDSGRTALAYGLLARLRYKDVVREVHRLTFGGSDTLPSRRIPRDSGRVYLLELPPDEQAGEGELEFRVKDDFCDQLVSLQEVLARRESRLVVLTRPIQWNRITGGAKYAFAPAVGPAPAPIEITRALVRAARPDAPLDLWLNDPRITKLFDRAVPIDAVDIADLILGEQLAGQSEDRAHDEQVENVVNARASWRTKLLEWHKEPGRTAIERNFLLAAAILRDAPVGHIYAKAADLCKAFADSQFELAGQSAPGIIQLLDSVGGEPAPSERIRFQRPHWEDAAVEYFWIDRPLSRQVFVKWLAETPLVSAQGDLVKISQEESLQIGRRVVDFAVRFAVRHERPLPLAKLAEVWDRNGKLWPLLVEAIDRAAITDVTSPYIRRMLLDWAKASEPSRKRLVAAVCARDFGVVHTGFALRRLRHIGDACTAEVLKDLQEAVRQLWMDEAARVTLLQYLGAWCRNEYAAGRVVFQTLALVEDENSGMPQVLTVFENDSYSGVSSNVLDIAWRSLLDHADLIQPDNPLQKCINVWMTAAMDDQGRDQIFLVLKAAASGATGTKPSVRREMLRGCIRSWAEAGVADREKRRLLQREFGEILDAEIARSARSIASGLEAR